MAALTMKMRRCDHQHDPSDHSFVSGTCHYAFWPTATPSAMIEGSLSHDTELTTAQKVQKIKDFVTNSGDHAGEANYNNEWDGSTWDN